MWLVVDLQGVNPDCSGLWYFEQMTVDLHKQQMGKPLTWYSEQRYTTVVVAILTVPFPLPGRDDQPPSSSQEEWYLNAIQQSRQHATHGSCLPPQL